MTIELPGINILNKYNQKIIGYEDLKTIVETSGNMVSHFDRQKLFSFGWKQDIVIKNRFIFDSILLK